MAGMKVIVTRELTERACQRDSQHCMIAEAIKQAHPSFQRILVDLQTIRWTDPNARGGPKRVVCFTPQKAQQALIDFDQGRPVEPFEMSLQYLQRTAAKGTRGRRHGARHEGQLVIEGGQPPPVAHLRGSDAPADKHRDRDRRRAERAAPEGASNVALSASRYRQYGLRLLRD